ncbi:MAG: hypothetical protein WDN69_20760 [Aliidongia sp.]
MNAERDLLDEYVWPSPREQFLDAHDVTRSLDQRDEERKCAAAEPNRNAVLR